MLENTMREITVINGSIENEEWFAEQSEPISAARFKLNHLKDKKVVLLNQLIEQAEAEKVLLLDTITQEEADKL